MDVQAGVCGVVRAEARFLAGALDLAPVHDVHVVGERAGVGDDLDAIGEAAVGLAVGAAAGDLVDAVGQLIGVHADVAAIVAGLALELDAERQVLAALAVVLVADFRLGLVAVIVNHGLFSSRDVCWFGVRRAPSVLGTLALKHFSCTAVKRKCTFCALSALCTRKASTNCATFFGDVVVCHGRGVVDCRHEIIQSVIMAITERIG